MQFQAGHVCGDERDLINGKPTGAVRISFGYSSSYRDIECLLNMLQETFLEKVPTHQISMEKPPGIRLIYSPHCYGLTNQSNEFSNILFSRLLIQFLLLQRQTM